MLQLEEVGMKFQIWGILLLHGLALILPSNPQLSGEESKEEVSCVFKGKKKITSYFYANGFQLWVGAREKMGEEIHFKNLSASIIFSFMFSLWL